MVRQANSIRPRNILGINSPNSQSYISQEQSCLNKSLKLDSIVMDSLNPYFISTLLYPLLISLGIYLGTLFLSLLGRVKALDAISVSCVYLILLSYVFVAGYVYRYFLGKTGDNKYLAYVYVCMYSLTYLPLALFLSLLLGSIGSILMFALILVTQYFLLNCLTCGHDFMSNKQRFLYNLLILVVQFIFLIGVEVFVTNRTAQGIL